MPMYCVSIKTLPATWVPEADGQMYPYWFVNSDMFPPTRQPITPAAMNHHGIAIAPENTDIDVNWTSEQRTTVFSYNRIPWTFDVPAPPVPEVVPVPEVPPEPAAVEVVPEVEVVPVPEVEVVPVPEVEVVPVPEVEVVPEPAAVEVVPVPEVEVVPEPAAVEVVPVPEVEVVSVPEVEVVPEPAAVEVAPEAPPRDEIFEPTEIEVVVDPGQNEITVCECDEIMCKCQTVEATLELFKKIESQIRSVKNRAAEFDHVSAKLNEFASKGFDVSASLESLAAQKSKVLTLELTVNERLEEIIAMCSDL